MLRGGVEKSPGRKLLSTEIIHRDSFSYSQRSEPEPDLLPLLQGVVGLLVRKFCPAFTVRNHEISSNIMSLERKDERK